MLRFDNVLNVLEQYRTSQYCSQPASSRHCHRHGSARPSGTGGMVTGTARARPRYNQPGSITRYYGMILWQEEHPPSDGCSSCPSLPPSRYRIYRWREETAAYDRSQHPQPSPTGPPLACSRQRQRRRTRATATESPAMPPAIGPVAPPWQPAGTTQSESACVYWPMA